MRRSTTPSLIVGFGLAAVGIFAGTVWKTSGTPILKLRPELEKRFATRGFRCWLKASEGRIEIQPPSSLPRDRASRRLLGAEALLKYLELTKGQTVVERALVLPPKGEEGAPEEITRGECDVYEAMKGQTPAVAAAASIAAGSSTSVTGVVPGVNGAAFYLSVPGQLGDTGARRVVTELLARFKSVSYVQLARPFGGPWEGGADVAILGSSTPGALK